MTTQVQTPANIHKLAEDALSAMKDPTSANGHNTEQTHKALEADLSRVRGAAVARANAANKRLRKQAVGATAASFGIGIALGLLASRCGVLKNARRLCGFRS